MLNRGYYPYTSGCGITPGINFWSRRRNKIFTGVSPQPITTPIGHIHGIYHEYPTSTDSICIWAIRSWPHVPSVHAMNWNCTSPWQENMQRRALWICKLISIMFIMIFLYLYTVLPQACCGFPAKFERFIGTRQES